MGFRPDVVVGNNKLSDGAVFAAAPRYTNESAAVVVEAHGKYFEQAVRGNVSFGGTAAAGAIIVASLSGAVGILYWNKSSGAVLQIDEIARISIGYISGANVPGGFDWYYLNAGANIGTGAPIATVVTAGSIVNALLGGAPVKTPNYVCYIGASTWAGFAFLRGTRFGLMTGVAATAVAPFQLWEEYDGSLVMPAGMALQFNSNAAQTGAFTFTADVIEVPALGALA